LTDEVLNGWSSRLESLELIPSRGGRFEVVLDGELVFSKAELGRHAEPGEVAALIRDRLGPEVSRE
jgi:selenoprotein W-related protein